MADVKVKFSTRWTDGDQVYEQGKSYEVHPAVASSLIRDGLAVEAPRQAQKSTPTPASKADPANKEGGK
ncbi:hypothetical protein [Kocuria sp.]|uniref:hypothetical protein n=1 Tax=Kocuria sp. TaxID=1871328 RepID=UPI0026DA88DB|nr:hypothetical protein [Kocuria sp.]MDO4920095.1 hypothetical protein [Kocuria sp.]